MLTNLRSILSIGIGVAVWGASTGAAQAQFGGLQIQIGGGGVGGLYVGGFSVPFGVGPSIPPSSQAYMGPQYSSGYRGYSSGYRGYFGVAPTLDIYDNSPLDYPTYRSPNYSNNRNSLDLLQLQQYQMQLRSEQLYLSAQQAYPYPSQASGSYIGDARTGSRYSSQAPRVSAASSDLRPGMVLPDGSTVISVGPLTPAPVSVSPQPSVEPNVLPSNNSSKANRAAF